MIVEQQINDKEMVGHTSNFLSVILPLDEELISKNIVVRIEKVEKIIKLNPSIDTQNYKGSLD